MCAEVEDELVQRSSRDNVHASTVTVTLKPVLRVGLPRGVVARW